MHVERIVLATDFSAAARAALEHAIAIAARFRARLYLFHVVDVRDGEGAHVLGNEECVDEFYELAERRAREELESLRDRVGAPPGALAGAIPIVECVRIGAPSEEVIRFAAEKQADLIVVGTHGRTGIRRVLVGSVAESIVRRAPCPVLAVRVSVEEEARAVARDPSHESRPIGRIVCALDGSASARAALRASCELAERFGSQVTAVNVIDDHLMAQAGMLSQLDAVSIEGRFSEIARANLERAISETVPGDFGSGIKRRIEVGRPAEAIARAAESEGAQLVACGTHGRTGLARALFGSIAEHIVRLSPCPVLTVREGVAAARAVA